MLLREKALQEKLRKDGFVVVPFLDAAEVKQLNDFYTSVHKGQEPPAFFEDIHMTTWCSDAPYKKQVSDELMSIFSRATERYFQNYRRLNNVFIVKRSGKQTTFKVHQDWSIVDETKFESVNVWIPLHDVDENSGALWVLKGSHSINRKVRGAGYLFPDYGAYYTELEKKAISVKLKAGEAIVFYHSVIHGSPPNLADEHRRAACFSVIPKEAPLCIYFQPSSKEALHQYEPPDEFMFQYENLRTDTFHKPPAREPVHVMPSYENKKVDLKELEPFLNERKGWFSFLKSSYKQ
jgi:hypothetical protein